MLHKAIMLTHAKNKVDTITDTLSIEEVFPEVRTNKGGVVLRVRVIKTT